MNRNSKLPCSLVYSTGDGTGTAEALGNWGFSNGKASYGGIPRFKSILSEMQRLNCKNKNEYLKVVYNRSNDPESWYTVPSPPESMPPWTFPEKRPDITYSSTVNDVNVEQWNPKWYNAKDMEPYLQLQEPSSYLPCSNVGSAKVCNKY